MKFDLNKKKNVTGRICWPKNRKNRGASVGWPHQVGLGPLGLGLEEAEFMGK